MSMEGSIDSVKKVTSRYKSIFDSVRKSAQVTGNIVQNSPREVEDDSVAFTEREALTMNPFSGPSCYET